MTGKASRAARCLFLAILFGAPDLFAQSDAKFTHPAADPAHDLTVKEIAKDVLLNFRGLIALDNLKPLVVGGSLTGLVVIPENDIRRYFGDGNRGGWTAPGRYLGSAPVIGGTSVFLFAVGRRSTDRRFRSFSYAFVQGMIVSESLVEATKVIVRRQRPDGTDRLSFPSGHAASSFLFATVLAEHYGIKAAIPGYLAASYVAATRVSGARHHLSDVVAGAAIGYIAGHTVVRRMKSRKDGHVSWGITPVRGGFLASLSIQP